MFRQPIRLQPFRTTNDLDPGVLDEFKRNVVCTVSTGVVTVKENLNAFEPLGQKLYLLR